MTRQDLSDAPDAGHPDNAGRLRVLRLMWAALLLGQLLFLAAIVLFVWPGDPRREPMPPEQRRIFLLVVGTMLAAVLPVGYLVRRSLYGPRDESGAVPAGRYASGNIIFWAMSEGVSLFALVCMMLDGKPWPFLAISLIAMVNQVINFPTGGPMEPDGAEMTHRRD